MEIPAPKHHSEGFLKLVEDAKTRVREISIEDYQKMLKDKEAGQLVDVREDHEWTAAHARGAMHLSKGTIERDIETTFPDKDEKLVLYCGGGFRSALTADNIQKMGYRNVLSLDGGWRAILSAGLPIEGEEVPASEMK
jgi:rhodanese-related sulfurtransferase